MAPKRTAPRMPAQKVPAPMPAVIDHSRMLAIIGVCDDTAKLHNWIENAGKKREVAEQQFDQAIPPVTDDRRTTCRSLEQSHAR